MELNQYQQHAQATNLLSGEEQPIRQLAAMLGLASESGSLLDVQKKLLTDAMGPEAHGDALVKELGDLLWYVSAVAHAVGLELEDVALQNLDRTRDRFASTQTMASLPVLDADAPLTESFPRRATFRFQPVHVEGRDSARLFLDNAEPNAFPDGPRTVECDDGSVKQYGYEVGAQLGDDLDDNTATPDGYRYHDALHISFMAHLGWSPTLRSMLRIKRKFNPEIDNSEDSARAIFADEGLVAVLARLAQRRMGFSTRMSIDSDVLDVVNAIVDDREVAKTPGWAWEKTIRTGFEMMGRLHDERGGVLHADLDRRELTFDSLG